VINKNANPIIAAMLIPEKIIFGSGSIFESPFYCVMIPRKIGRVGSNAMNMAELIMMSVQNPLRDLRPAMNPANLETMKSVSAQTPIAKFVETTD